MTRVKLTFHILLIITVEICVCVTIIVYRARLVLITGEGLGYKPAGGSVLLRVGIGGGKGGLEGG